MKRIYLDNSATTIVDKQAAQIVQEFMTIKYGNPSSMHNFGQEAKFALDDARETMAKIINANINEIFFTSGGTESDNWAIRGVIMANLKKIFNGEKIHLITSTYEHSAVIKTFKYFLEKIIPKGLMELTLVKPDKEGRINPEDVAENIKSETILVSIMHINNELGSINDIQAIGKICRDKKVLFHTDCVQSFTKEIIDVKKMNIDLLSASSHKIYGPMGVGFLYIRKGVKIEPNQTGGQQELLKRTGTENLPGIAGFAEAARIAYKEIDLTRKRLSKFKKRIAEAVLKTFPDTLINGSFDERKTYSGVLNLTFPNVEGEALALNLDMEGIAVSTGSACSSHDTSPSHALTAIGLTPQEAQSSIRISIGKFNTEEEIDYTIEKLLEIVGKLRSYAGL